MNIPIVRFKIVWTGSDYRVSIPRYKGGEVMEAAAYDGLLSAARHVWDKAMLTIHDDTDDEAAATLAEAIGYKYERKFKS
jgi:hypothetical protein